MIDLNEIAQGCLQISELRIENGSSIDKDALKHCSGEVVEAVEARDKLLSVNITTHPHAYELLKARFADELMDIFICAAVEAVKVGIDIEAALIHKVSVNTKRALGVGDKK